MKRAAAFLMVMVMASLWQQALALGELDSPSVFGPERHSFSSPGSGIKKMEEKMAGALAALPSRLGSEGGNDPVKSAADTLAGGNSSLENSSINASQPQNGSLNNISIGSSEDNSTLTGKQTGADDSDVNAGSGSANRFKGSYATSASRHEIGKGGVESSMSLHGEFEMDNSIKFQDQGF
jgi:hypothetical protein